MSPKGDQIAYLLSVPREIYKDDDGKPYHELHVVDFDGVSRAYVSGKIDVSAVAWSADGQSIYFVAMRDPDEKFNSLFEIALTGGEAVQKFTHISSIGAIHPSPDGKRIAFLATEAAPEKTEELAAKGFKAVVYEESILPTKVWMLDLATGEAVAQDLTGSASEFRWSSEGSRYAVALAPTPLIDDSFTSRDIYIVNENILDGVAQADARAAVADVEPFTQAYGPAVAVFLPGSPIGLVTIQRRGEAQREVVDHGVAEVDLVV